MDSVGNRDSAVVGCRPLTNARGILMQLKRGAGYWIAKCIGCTRGARSHIPRKDDECVGELAHWPTLPCSRIRASFHMGESCRATCDGIRGRGKNVEMVPAQTLLVWPQHGPYLSLTLENMLCCLAVGTQLQLMQDDIAPLFDGAAWAGTVRALESVPWHQ